MDASDIHGQAVDPASLSQEVTQVEGGNVALMLHQALPLGGLVDRGEHHLADSTGNMGPMALDVDPERFDELVGEAIDLIPDELADYMDNVAILTADRPTPMQARHGRRLLGLYEGVNLTRRGPITYNGVMPDRITIFRENHLRLARTEDDLRRRVAHTVAHEIVHHFGISDDRLRELGAY